MTSAYGPEPALVHTKGGVVRTAPRISRVRRGGRPEEWASAFRRQAIRANAPGAARAVGYHL